MADSEMFAEIVEKWRKLYESFDGDAVWIINPDVRVEWEIPLGTFIADSLPTFPSQALDAPRDFDGTRLSRTIVETTDEA